MANGWTRAATIATGIGIANLMAFQQLRGSQENRTSQAAALRGLDGVVVAVELPAGAAAAFRITASAIENRVDQTLRAGGIRNLSREESVRQGAAKLCVAIQSVRIGESAELAWRVDVAVREPVLLVRDPQRSVVATTWQGPGAVVAGEGVKAESALKQIEEQIDNFVRSYHDANKVRK